jgi:hypothetical protein
VRVGGVLKVGSLHNGVHRARLLAHAAVDALGHVDVVPGSRVNENKYSTKCGSPLTFGLNVHTDTGRRRRYLRRRRRRSRRRRFTIGRVLLLSNVSYRHAKKEDKEEEVHSRSSACSG